MSMVLQNNILTTPKGNKITITRDDEAQLQEILSTYSDGIQSKDLYDRFFDFSFSEEYIYNDLIPYYILLCTHEQEIRFQSVNDYHHHYATYAVDLITGNLVYTTNDGFDKMYTNLKRHCDQHDEFCELKLLKHRVTRLESIIEHLVAHSKDVTELSALVEEASKKEISAVSGLNQQPSELQSDALPLS